MKCNRTGIEFEPKSARVKNHPAISALFAEKRVISNYRAACSAADEIKSGEACIDSASAACEYILQTISASLSERSDRARDYAKLQDKRARFNSAARAAGYRWYFASEEDNDFHAGWASAPTGWMLLNPAGLVATAEEIAAIS